MKEEITAKVRAVIFSAKKIPSVPETDTFFSIIYNLQNDDLSDGSITKNLNKLQGWHHLTSIKNDVPESDIQAYEQLLRLSEELYVFGCLMSTLYNIFNNELNELKIKELEKSGYFEKLAVARQALSMDSSVSRTIILECRLAQNMTALN